MNQQPRKQPRKQTRNINRESKTIKVKPMEYVTLDEAVRGLYELTASDVEQLMELLTQRCNPRTKYAVRLALENIQEQEHTYGIYERVIKESKIGRWQYIAGQSYPDEIRTVRSLLRGW